MSSSKPDNSKFNESAIAIIIADIKWLKKEKRKTISILAATGIIVFVLSIIYQDIYLAIIRGSIFTVACLIFYYKSDSFINYKLLFFSNGKILLKKGLIKKEIIVPNFEKIPLIKKGENWLFSKKELKIPITAFPNLDSELKEINN